MPGMSDGRRTGKTEPVSPDQEAWESLKVEQKQENSIVRPPGLPTDAAMQIFLAGRTALTEVKGMNLLLIKGFVLLYILSSLLAVAGVGGLYLMVIQPLAEHLTYWSAGQGLVMSLVASLLKAILWIGQFILLVGSLLLSFRLALSMMGLWFELLVAHILRDFQLRRGERLTSLETFELKPWLRSVGRSLNNAWITLLASVVALGLGFIPFVGPFITLFITAWLLGRDVREPYLTVLAEQGHDYHSMSRGQTLWTLRIGLMPLIIGLIPFVGWLLLPVVMIYLVAGVAWIGELNRSKVKQAS